MKQIKTFKELHEAIKELYPKAKYKCENFIGQDITINKIKVRIVNTSINQSAGIAYNIIKDISKKISFNFINEIKTLDKTYNFIKAIKACEE